MSSNFQALVPAVLALNESGAPVSHRFNDIYYAGDHPLQQARQVFLGGNDLPRRWHGRRQFTVLETGFGLGHNFLALWQAWRDDPGRCPRLHMVSIEAHPFRHDDLKLLLHRLPTPERTLGQALVRQWPVLTPGIHRLEFEDGAVTLTLALGPVQHMARQLDLGFDACFLDGFAPRVNPEMWTPHVFRQLARMARCDATLATWCSAGQVRRDLQNAGFLITRSAGLGAKRHMITGRLRPGMGQRCDTPARDVIIIGGGFAGAAAAYALRRHGHDVSVIDPALAEGPEGSHREHRAAALTPVLSRDDDIRARLSRAGVNLALLRWGALDAGARPVRCGAFEAVPVPEQTAWKAALARLAFPVEWVRWLSACQAAERTLSPPVSAGLWYAQGCLVRPERLLGALLGGSGIHHIAAVATRLSADGRGRWSAWDPAGRCIASADVVVVANSWLAGRLLAATPGIVLPQRLRSLHRFAGQLSYFQVAHGDAPACIVSGDGLCLPDGAQRVVGGSTYVSDTSLSIITAQGHHEIRQKVADLLNKQPSQLGRPRCFADGWAGWRAAVRDRLPVIGELPAAPGLWLACGFGSRGLTWSALGAELLAAKLNHEPIPLERELSRKIAPL